jgi:2-amino-4-hydroxy-6-hydroxymethyldihydropteridine diphosphokinase
MPRSLIGLGSNLGDRSQTLARAVQMLRAQPGVAILAQSSWHGTAPVGGPAGQGEFLNGALVVETVLTPEALHDVLGAIEARLGRERAQRWGPRTLDLDLLLYDQLVVNTPGLVVPHPRMAFRRFVIEPAAEVAGEMVHPKIGWTIAQLLEHLNTAPPYVALTGLPGVGKWRLAQALAESHDGVFLPDPIDTLGGSGVPGLPTGRTLTREIELLDHRAAMLDAGKWANRDRLTVTDFWFDQSLAYAQIDLDDENYQKLRLHWEKARCGVLSPKVLVVLDPPPSATIERSPYKTLLEQLRDFPLAWWVRIPLLHTQAATAAEQLAEVSAAVDAMK